METFTYYFPYAMLIAACIGWVTSPHIANCETRTRIQLHAILSAVLAASFKYVMT